MAKVKILIRPTGCINGQDWPQVGEEMELADVVAESMSSAGLVAPVKGKAPVEKRPSKAPVETRKAD